MEQWQLKQRQNLPLDIKIKLTQQKIHTFYNSFQGLIYVSYSGGKDSEVLLHITRQIKPNTPAVFCDTGTELHTREHALKKADIVIKPKKSMIEVWNKYGLPFPSKQQANFIYKVKHTKSSRLKNRLMTGVMSNGSKTMFKLAKKWQPLLRSDIEVSDRCCHYLKKEPFKRFNKESKLKPMIATMASDGMERKKQYMQNGCINFEKEMATPLGFWTEQDILEYLKKYKVDYCQAYGEIVECHGKLTTTKEKRTGCIGCLFGIHLEKEPNRLQRLEKENPRRHNIILNKWCDGKIKKLLDLFDIKYINTQTTLEDFKK